MTKYVTSLEANNLLQSIVGQTLQYGIKSQGCELYDFGFGNYMRIPNSKGESRKVCQHTLHITCRFKIISKTGVYGVDRYFEDTPCEEFHTKVKRLVGLNVKRVALSDKHDLWLDLGDYWIVFATYEDGEESWRYFTPGSGNPHMVASDSWVRLDY